MTHSNLGKLSFVLLALLALLGVLFFGALTTKPEPGPDVHLPSMENIPPNGTHLKIEVAPSAKP